MYEQKFISTLSETQLLLRHRISFSLEDFSNINPFDLIVNRFNKNFSIELDIPVSKFYSNYTYAKTGPNTGWKIFIDYEGKRIQHIWSDKRQAMEDLLMRSDDMRVKTRNVKTLFTNNVNNILWAALKIDLFNQLDNANSLYEVLFKKIFNRDFYTVDFYNLTVINNKLGGSPAFEAIKNSYRKLKAENKVSLVSFDQLLHSAFGCDIPGVINFLYGRKTKNGYVYEYTPFTDVSEKVFNYIFQFCSKIKDHNDEMLCINLENKQLFYKVV